MNPKQLLAHFDRISEAPDAIPRLRRFILDLAVRGKLVEQNPDDEPASELLKRIHAEKARLAKSGKVDRAKRPSAPLEEDIPFPVPGNWCWSTLAEAGILSPRNSADDRLQTSFVPMSLISAEYGTGNGHEIRPWGEIKGGYTHFAEGDVGLAKITPCFENGKSTVFRGLVGGIGAGTTELHVVRPIIICADYVLVFLKSPHFIESGIPRMTGTAGQKRVPAEYFAYSPFPLPPFAEQHRIVAKVDELMALCDRLEAAQAKRERRRDRLVTASLHRLEQPGEAANLRESARFYLSHVTRLTTRPEHIQQLRQTILNLAVRGRLVPQDPDDEPASELLKRIDAEKTRPGKRAAIAEQKPASNGLNLSAVDLPAKWEPVRAGTLCTLVTSGSRGWAEFYSNTGPKFIRAQNIRFGRLLLDDLACVNPPEKSEGTRTQVSKGDLLVVITGAGVTNPALLDQELGEAYVSQHVALIRPMTTALSPWLLLCLMAPAGGRNQLVERAYGAGKPGLNLDNIRFLSIPLPPLAEQHRIVAKVDELMALCDRLEAQLATAQTESRRLLESVLHHALDGE